LRERLAAQVRVDEAEPSEAIDRAPATSEFGDKELMCVAEEHLVDPPTPIDQQTDLATGLAGELGDTPRDLGTDELVRWNTSGVQRQEGFRFAAL